jgi:hypothetical protein
MKKLCILLLIIFSQKANAQLNTCTFVTDTLFKLNSCSMGPGPCPHEYVDIDTSLIHYAAGLNTYLVCYDPLNPTGCINDYQLGTLNFGDTIPITYVKHKFGFYSLSCTLSTFKIAIIVVGQPTTIAQSYYCKTDLVNQFGFIVDGCVGYCDAYIFPATGKNCSTSNCTPTIVNNETKTYFSFFPNPANDLLTINFDNYYLDNSTLIIYNTLGQVVLKEKISGRTSNLNITSLESGIYYVSIDNGSVTERQKFIKNAH